jgi:hypothetical protein
MKTTVLLLSFLTAFVLTVEPTFGQAQKKKPVSKSKQATKQPPKPPAKKKPKTKFFGPKPIPFINTALTLAGPTSKIGREGIQCDLPATVSDKNGKALIAYLEWDGEIDRLILSRETEKGMQQDSGEVAEGVLHKPAIAIDGKGTVWIFWGETHKDTTVNLKARSWSADRGFGIPVTIADSDAAEAFVVAGTDSKGRAWASWQSFRAGEADIYARFLDPKSGKWSKQIAVATQQGGDWEPDIAFDQKGNAWIAYDSSRGNEFNLNLARVNEQGQTKEFAIAHSPKYEARASITATARGDGFWITAERGKEKHGLDYRGHGNETGINAKKSVLFGKFDIASGKFTEIPLGHAGWAGNPVNRPVVGVGKDGNPWVVYRYFNRALWRIAATGYRLDSKTWSSRRRIPNSSFGQDRTALFLPAQSKGDLRLCWPSDERPNKAHQTASVFLAALPSSASLPAATPEKPTQTPAKKELPHSHKTPERPAFDRHTWKVGGQTYGLFWGDVHRHTDVSNCRTGFDGCIVDHFRYAYDLAKIDFLGTSDHTDAGKIYHPYEWWHNQRMHDALHSPGRFNTVYVYEREQKWPWGHRNVVFAQRGGPVVYIKRPLYLNSPWQKTLPVDPQGAGEISPYELWDLLKKYEKPVALVSHTGATGMGTDWKKYEKFDYSSENIVEIFQGARVSYEGAGAPQPTVGIPSKTGLTSLGRTTKEPHGPIKDFGKFSNGTYQTALSVGHNLGVFASSDHISQHASYGGVFCKDFSREGIIEAMDNRRTIAATDKIYLNFTCNGEPLGSFIKTEKAPKLWFKVDGTGPFKRITIVRNEKDWKHFNEFVGQIFEKTISDEEMLEGENRYYIRVIQRDGNMAWSSPVWVTRK